MKTPPKKGNSMSIETAIEYISDIINAYLTFIPVSNTTKKDMKQALYLAISALKTIEDMKLKGASLYGQATERPTIIDSEKS
jgi:hypothetical protein